MKTLAILLAVLLIAPSGFLVAPQKVHAQTATVEVGPILQNTFLNTLKATLTSISTFTSARASEALVFEKYVLQPLGFIMSGNLLKSLTSGVISFVVGTSNGTGAPQFVQNLQGHMQSVGDTSALAFFASFGRNSNSPFAGAITSSLRTNYLQQTSMAGFFAANQNTLAQSSPNVNAFLAGDWSRGGGIAAWFSLTTQNQNNPYTLYQASQSQLASVVAGATGARLAELNWNQGFLSWCGTSDDATATDAPDTATVGASVGDPCFKDGIPGVIKTPGSTIKATLDKVLGANQDKLVQMGQLASEVGSILGNIGTIMNTVNFATQILGGSGSGGLYGIGQTSGSNARSGLMMYQSAPGYLGVTQSTVNQNAAALPSSGSDMTNRVAQYNSSWNAIKSAANAASANVTLLMSACTDVGNTTEASEAQSALTNEIAPVLARANAAFAQSAAATAMVAKVQNELNSGTNGAPGAYIADLQILQTMPPTDLDVSNASQDAQSFEPSVASPDGSLVVRGGSLVTQMSLIATNAEALKTSVCTPAANSNNNNGNNSD